MALLTLQCARWVSVSLGALAVIVLEGLGVRRDRDRAPIPRENAGILAETWQSQIEISPFLIIVRPEARLHSHQAGLPHQSCGNDDGAYITGSLWTEMLWVKCSRRDYGGLVAGPGPWGQPTWAQTLALPLLPWQLWKLSYLTSPYLSVSLCSSIFRRHL